VGFLSSFQQFWVVESIKPPPQEAGGGKRRVRPLGRKHPPGFGQIRRMNTTTRPSLRSPSHFLVVEPDPLFRLLLCVTLADRFTDFHAVASFNEALALLKEHSFSAIIAEYHLPGGTGIALHEEARSRLPQVPFVLDVRWNSYFCRGPSLPLPCETFRAGRAGRSS
jgi:hypothetical protein